MMKDYLQVAAIMIVLFSCSITIVCGGGNHPLPQNLSTETELLSNIRSVDEMAITAGDLARSRGTTADVRNFGVLLVRDHSDADRRIQALANEWGIHITEPMQKTPEEQHTIQGLKQEFADLQLLAGPKFDHEFIEFTANSHRILLQTLQRESRQLQPSPIKVFIIRLVRILRQHEFLCRWCWGHCLNYN